MSLDGELSATLFENPRAEFRTMSDSNRRLHLATGSYSSPRVGSTKGDFYVSEHICEPESQDE